jgi:hypothetical protein
MAYNGYIRDNVDTIDSIASSYTNFTASLVTSTFEALMDSNLKQIEAYTDMVSTMSKDLTTYINETTDEVQDEQVLQYLEQLPLQQAGLISAPENEVGIQYSDAGEPQLVELDPDNNPVSSFDIKNVGSALLGLVPGGGTLSGLAGNAISSINQAVQLPGAAGPALDTLTDLKNEVDGTADTNNLNRLIFKAVAQRIASNKYALLENMVRLGFMRLVVDNGVIQTDLDMTFTEVDKYSRKEKNKVKDRQKRKTVTKTRPSFASFLFGGRSRTRDRAKHVRLEVNKTVEKVNTKNTGRVNMGAMVRIEFSTDYQPLSEG